MLNDKLFKTLFNQKNILITGGTGSFATHLIHTLLTHHNPKKIIVYSRDEFKQYNLQNTLETQYPHSKDVMRYFIGDIQDKSRLLMATKGVHYIIHTAALKHVPVCEYNPFEAVKTNIIGSQNVIDSAITNKVEKIIALSTDKACQPVNLYGSTKSTMERLFIAANNYTGTQETSFSLVRYGNVINSRGSVLPYYQSLLKSNPNTTLPLTHKDMTRFIITLDQATLTVYNALLHSVGGEIFIPILPSILISDLIKTLNTTPSLTAIREGEKLYETLITQEELPNTKILNNDYCVIQPSITINKPVTKYSNYKPFTLPLNTTSYSSNTNTNFLNPHSIKQLLWLWNLQFHCPN